MMLSIFRNTDSRRWAHHLDAFTTDDYNSLIFPNRSLLRIKEADMLHRNWMIRMLGQFACQARIAGVFSRAVEGIELIVRILPSLLSGERTTYPETQTNADRHQARQFAARRKVR
jgi:hypothetical protein